MCPSNFTSDRSIFSAMETINCHENLLMKIFKVHNGAKVVGIVTVTFPPRGGIKVPWVPEVFSRVRGGCRVGRRPTCFRPKAEETSLTETGNRA